MLIIGPRDAEAGTVSVRDRIDGDLGAMTVEEAMAKFQEEVAEKRVKQVVKNTAVSEPAVSDVQNEY